MMLRGTALIMIIAVILALPATAPAASESIPDTAMGMALELDSQLAERVGAAPPVRGATMIVTTPQNLNDLENVAPVARLLSEEMTAWFVASGYRVTEMRTGRYVLFKPESGELLLTRRPDMLSEKFRDSELILAGTYIGTAKYIRFNMRLIQAATGEIIAMSSRTLAISEDTAEIAGQESREAFSRLRPTVGTRLGSLDKGPVREAADSVGDMFSGLMPGGSDQHPVYAPSGY